MYLVIADSRPTHLTWVKIFSGKLEAERFFFRMQQEMPVRNWVMKEIQFSTEECLTCKEKYFDSWILELKKAYMNNEPSVIRPKEFVECTCED